jgi:hypothetical protein
MKGVLMCKYTFPLEGSAAPVSAPLLPETAWHEKIKLVAYGVDTLVINVRYADADLEPVQRELAEDIALRLDILQAAAKRDEAAVASDWSFLDHVLFVEPHGAGRQWRWLLKCRLLSLVVSSGRFNGVIAQVRFSAEYLWAESWAGDALSKVYAFLSSVFGERIHFQASSVDLCADLCGYDFGLANYEQDFVTRARKQAVVYGPDEVNLDGRTPSYLRFSSSGAPLSCRIYDKWREIEQKSKKTWMYDLWRRGLPGPCGGSWDGSASVWRVEFHFTRAFLRNLTSPIEGAYSLLDQFQALWSYAVGMPAGDEEGDDGAFSGWLRYVVPTTDENWRRWPLHPAWRVVQSAFAESPEGGLGPVVRKRIREKNLERGLAAVVGYTSTLAAWLGGDYAASDADMSLTLQWLYSSGEKYLDEKERDFMKEVRRKQQLYATAQGEEE